MNPTATIFPSGWRLAARKVVDVKPGNVDSSTKPPMPKPSNPQLAPSSNVPSGRENWLQAIRNARVKATYRSLRLRVAELEWSLATNSLQLDFVLGRGAFATAVLRELALCEDVAVGEAMWV